MQFDIDNMAAIDRYELLLGTIVPRPIALVTTISADGTINAAPYSLFNVMGHDPAVAMISVLAHPEQRLKDTRWCARLSDPFAMDRPTWAQWTREGKVG
jgi:flavin reductase (DIM6/NTAB) family NADH-FMN oxidoreductase RutF